MTERNSKKLVQEAYAAIGQGDIPRLMEMMSEDVEIRFPGPADIPFAGTYHGRSGVGEFFEAVGSNADVHEFSPDEFVVDDGMVLVLGHERITARPTGQEWDTEWAMAWTVRDNEITLLREYHQTDAIAQAFRA